MLYFAVFKQLLLRLTHWKPFVACIIWHWVDLRDCVCCEASCQTLVECVSCWEVQVVFDCSAAAEAETRRRWRDAHTLPNPAESPVHRIEGFSLFLSIAVWLLRMTCVNAVYTFTIMHRCVLRFGMSCLFNPLRHDWLLDSFHSYNHCICVQPRVPSRVNT